MKKLLNKILANPVNIAWDPLKNHNLLFLKKKKTLKRRCKLFICIQMGTKLSLDC